ncbi:hypothetical protein N7465_002947, partial [Penicillium sp. CMV-2018d]
ILISNRLPKETRRRPLCCWEFQIPSRGMHYSAGNTRFARTPLGPVGHRQCSLATLPPGVNSVIQRLQRSDYHTIDNSEASIRDVLELLILDWLYHLSDSGALERLRLYSEVDADLLLGDTYSNSRADWLLCHDDPQYGIDSTRNGVANFLCQIATYFATIQASRTKVTKIHAIAFGITTDSNKYQFWFMDSERRLFSSVVFEWRLHKAKIITWIDKIDAHFTTKCPSTQLDEGFRLSLESDYFPLTERLPLDIIVPDVCHLVELAWY